MPLELFLKNSKQYLYEKVSIKIKLLSLSTSISTTNSNLLECLANRN